MLTQQEIVKLAEEISTINNAGVVVISHNNKINFASKAFVELSGKNLNELVGDDISNVLIFSSEEQKAVLPNKNGGLHELSLTEIKSLKGIRIILTKIINKDSDEKENDELFCRKIFDFIPDIISIHDTNSNILFFNKSGLEILEKKEKDLIGKKCFSVIGQECECDICPTRMCIKSGKTEKIVKYFPEYNKWMDVRAYPVFSKNGKIEKIIEHMRDITSQMKIEIELSDTRNEWKQIFDAIGHPTVILGPDKEITEINNAFSLLCKKPREELIGKKCFDVFQTLRKNDEMNCPLDEMIRDGKDKINTIEIKTRVGNFLVSGTPIFDKLGNLIKVIHVATDITKLKEAETNLDESEHKLGLLLDNIPGVAYRCKLDQSWTMLFLSNGCKELTGYMPEDLINNRTLEYSRIIHPDDRQNVWESVKKSIPKDKLFIIEFRIITKSGKIKHVWERGKVVTRNGKEYIEGVIFDYTERKNTEFELKNSEEKYRLLIENQNDLIIKVDNLGRITYASPSYCKSFGKTEADFLNTSFMPLIHEDDREATGKAMSTLQYFPHTCYVEQRTMTANGWRWYAWSDKAVINKNNEIVEIIGVGRDITERKIIEFELIKAKEKAEENDKLKSSFLANMSHEIRTPMNSLIGFSELISQPELEEEERISYATIINSSCNQLLKIVNDLIDISQIETKQMRIYNEVFDASEIIDELLQFFNPQAKEKNLTLIAVKQGKEPCIVNTDKAKLAQILINLLNNAIKFTSKGEIKFGYTYENSTIRFFVSDTGKGIDPSNHTIIFDRFRQVGNDNNEFGGTGLGLSISNANCGLLGTKIKIDSALGKGSEFSFTLPLTSVNCSNPLTVGDVEKSQVNLSGYRILVAEDERVNFLLMKTILTKAGADVIRAVNGFEAIEIVKEATQIVDLVLMDIKMPGLTGSDAFLEIKKQNPTLPVIACTAYAQTEETNMFFEQGFDDYIPKPINRKNLLKIISNNLIKKA